MNYLLLLLVGVMSVGIISAQQGSVIPTLEDVRDGPNPDGSYYFRYATANGIFREEQSVPTGPNTFTVTGSYTYTAPNGQIIEMQYIADENGYRAFPASRGGIPLIPSLGAPVPRPERPSIRPRPIQQVNIQEQSSFNQGSQNSFNTQQVNPFSGSEAIISNQRPPPNSIQQRPQRISRPTPQNQNYRGNSQSTNNNNNNLRRQQQQRQQQQRQQQQVQQQRPLQPTQRFPNQQSFRNRQGFQNRQQFQNFQNQNRGNFDSIAASSYPRSSSTGTKYY